MLTFKKGHDRFESEADSSGTHFMPMFEFFREELDQHHDRRDRIGRASRDITALSKKIIFALQRVRALKQAISSTVAIETEERFFAIRGLFKSVSPDLQGINAWRYQRQVSAGLQEYTEALSFEHYLRNQSLISHGEASNFFPVGIVLNFDDYILGIFDLVGELMRFAITTMATEGSLPVSRDGNATNERTILTDMRLLRIYFESLDTTSYGGTGLGKGLEKKMEVMKLCVAKVEAALYGMVIRGRERPRGWVPDTADLENQERELL